MINFCTVVAKHFFIIRNEAISGFHKKMLSPYEHNYLIYNKNILCE